MSTKTLYDYIKEKATLEGDSSREWQASNPGCDQQHYRAGASNCCLEILDWMERNPDSTQAKLKTAEERLEKLRKQFFIHAIGNNSQPDVFYTTGIIAIEGQTFEEAIDPLQPTPKV